MKIQVVIVAAGKGERLKASLSKGLVPLAGKPLFIHSLLTLSGLEEIDSCLVTAPLAEMMFYEQAVIEAGLSKSTRVIAGGETRQQSVLNALQALDPDTQRVLIHDGARPLLLSGTARQALSMMQDHDAVIVAVPLKSTVKQVNVTSMMVEQTLERSKLWEVQTPQIFDKETLLRAHTTLNDPTATDDAVLVERIGVPVRVVEGDYSNIKITTPGDLDQAGGVIERKANNDE